MRSGGAGGTGVRYLLHPPFLRALGVKRKIALPAWLARPAFGVLRAGRRLRGTPLDLFGMTAARRTERRLAAQYATRLHHVLPTFSPDRVAVCAELARLPLTIRGYEHIKLASIERYQTAWAALEARLADQETARAEPDSPPTAGSAVISRTSPRSGRHSRRDGQALRKE